MQEIACPKCGAVYSVEVDFIGKECECTCGKTFIAEVRHARDIQKLTLPVKQPVQTQTANPKPQKTPVPFTAIFFRIVGYALLTIGLLIIIIPSLAYNLSGFVGGLLGGGGFILSSIPFFVISQIITFLSEIAHNTYELRRRLPPMNIDEAKPRQ